MIAVITNVMDISEMQKCRSEKERAAGVLGASATQREQERAGTVGKLVRCIATAKKDRCGECCVELHSGS